jgi:aminomethyltransferase
VTAGNAEARAAKALPLELWHRARGARLAERRGHLLPLDYGDPAGEAHALREGCGLLDRSEIARLEVIGADRQRFLNGLVTVDVPKLRAGTGVYGFVTGPKGQVLAEVVVHCLSDRLWLELPPGREGELRRHLQKYVVADRVEVLSLVEMLPLTLVGPECEAALSRSGVAAPDQPWGNARAELSGTEVELSRHERLGAPAVTVWAASAIAVDLAQWLVAELGAVPVGDAAAEALRVEAGVACWGVDFGEDNLPQEMEIEGAVDYRKGCYLGQEVIARLHYRGQAPRLLRSLVLPPSPALRPGLEISFEGRAAGRLTSVTVASRGDRAVGLAVLQRRACEGGTRVELEGGIPGLVCLPGAALDAPVPVVR